MPGPTSPDTLGPDAELGAQLQASQSQVQELEAQLQEARAVLEEERQQHATQVSDPCESSKLLESKLKSS